MYKILTLTVGILASAISLAQDIGFADDFNKNTLDADRFFPLQQSNSSGELVNGQIKLTAVGNDQGEQAALSTVNVTDYLEASLTLSSESVMLNRDSEIESNIDLRSFGTTEGGDVRLRVRISKRGDGRSRLRYCMDYINNFQGLLDGESCVEFPMRSELDTVYRSSISIDRATQQVTYQVNGLSQVVSLGSAFIDASAPQAAAWSVAREGTAVTFVDDFRNSNSAVTESEAEAGLSSAPAFPEALSTEDLTLDSTLNNPIDVNRGGPMAFVDDFSIASTTAFGLWGGRTRGDSGIYYEDNALHLETNAASADQGNYSNLNFYEDTDSIFATLSLPSQSAIPADPNASNRIRVMLRTINLEQPVATDESADAEFVLGLRERGDGRREVEFYGETRGEERINFNLDDLDEFSEFRDFVPEYDTPYDVSITVDREQKLVTFRLDSLQAQFSLPGEAYPAFRTEPRVENSFNGSSGRGIGRIHAIKTDNYDFDFSQTKYAVGPYRPKFNDSRADRSVTLENGRLKMTAAGSGEEWRPARIAARAQTDYIAADLTLSSESTIDVEGRIHVQVGANLLNDIMDGGVEENDNGQISAHIEIHATDTEQYAAYCAWRNDGESYSDVIGGDTDLCLARFDLVIEFDQTYNASIELDRENSQIIYRLNDEEKTYTLATGIFEPKSFWAQTRAVTYDGSTSVGYADNFTVGKDSPPLANSLANLIADESDLNGGTGDTGQQNAVGTSSGGGCSVSKENGGLAVPMLALLGFIAFARRKRTQRAH